MDEEDSNGIKDLLSRASTPADVAVLLIGGSIGLILLLILPVHLPQYAAALLGILGLGLKKAIESNSQHARQMRKLRREIEVRTRLIELNAIKELDSTPTTDLEASAEEGPDRRLTVMKDLLGRDRRILEQVQRIRTQLRQSSTEHQPLVEPSEDWASLRAREASLARALVETSDLVIERYSTRLLELEGRLDERLYLYQQGVDRVHGKGIDAFFDEMLQLREDLYRDARSEFSE